jgi:hypothetical protein
MTNDLKLLLIEEFLLILVYVLSVSGRFIPQISVLVVCLVLLFFMIVLADELILDLIEFSELKTRRLSAHKI